MRVKASEFYKRPGHYFDLVVQGITVEITRHGKVISRLEPPRDSIADDFVTPPIISSGTQATSTDFMFGAFTFGGIWQGLAPVERLERALGFKLNIVHWFMNFEHAWDVNLVNLASSDNRVPLLSWEPDHVNLADITTGCYDVYLTSWATGAKDFGKPLYLRPLPEMNGDWVSWNGQPDALVKAWRYIVRLFRFHGATNVKWVWCPNLTDVPNSAENAMERYYPGTNFVDVLALDGYNWGTTRSLSSWQSFEDVFTEPYERITALGSQPFWIAETACAEQGGNKATWIKDMFAGSKFSRLKAIVWFNQKKEADWRIESSQASLVAFQEGLDDLVVV